MQQAGHGEEPVNGPQVVKECLAEAVCSDLLRWVQGQRMVSGVEGLQEGYMTAHTNTLDDTHGWRMAQSTAQVTSDG
ncbi:hypothetical protein [Flavobacterium sp.]|uniref:hypothetical protein n=1 Tax=Flavobacterium sp. TaxID=239 RepID=UPI00403435FC